jgi:hypothetical protein
MIKTKLIKMLFENMFFEIVDLQITKSGQVTWRFDISRLSAA